MSPGAIPIRTRPSDPCATTSLLGEGLSGEGCRRGGITSARPPPAAKRLCRGQPPWVSGPFKGVQDSLLRDGQGCGANAAQRFFRDLRRGVCPASRYREPSLRNFAPVHELTPRESAKLVALEHRPVVVATRLKCLRRLQFRNVTGVRRYGNRSLILPRARLGVSADGSGSSPESTGGTRAPGATARVKRSGAREVPVGPRGRAATPDRDSVRARANLHDCAHPGFTEPLALRRPQISS